VMLPAAVRGLFLAGAMLVVCESFAAPAIEIPWKIDEPTAQRLAAEAHYGADKYLDAFDDDSNLSRPFFVFYGVNESPAEGSFGYFAVNPWTGDVWSLWGCRELSTPALRRSQAEIRKRFTREELKQYARLRRLKPECTRRAPEAFNYFALDTGHLVRRHQPRDPHPPRRRRLRHQRPQMVDLEGARPAS